MSKNHPRSFVLAIATTLALSACATKQQPKAPQLTQINQTPGVIYSGDFCTMGTHTDLGGIATTPNVDQQAIGHCEHPEWRNEDLLVIYLGDDGTTTPRKDVEQELDSIMHPENYLAADEIDDIQGASCSVGSECESIAAPLHKGVIVHFASDSSNLTNQSEADLVKRIAQFAKGKKIVIDVTGFTDNTSTPSHNAKLSILRAEAIKKLLAENGMDTQFVVTSGQSSSHPVGTNKTSTGRAQNRRTEIKSNESVPEEESNGNAH